MKIETVRLILLPITYEFICAKLENKPTYINEYGYKINEEDWLNSELALILPIFKGQLKVNEINGFCPWLVIYKKDNQVIGNCGCHGDPDKDGNVEIGYEISSKYRNLGLAREAVLAYIEWLKYQSSVKNILAECDKGNKRSINLLKKIGMKKINKLENSYIFRL